MTKTRRTVLAAVLAAGLISAGCTEARKSQRQSGANAVAEQESVSTGFSRLSNAQPVPTFDWSQERQTLIDIETLRAQGAVTTSAGYLEGVGLVWWCTSKGAPVPSTYQLSAATQWVDIPGDDTRSLMQVDQGEPTGVYVGPSTGTWTLCVDDAGQTFAQYWEGYVASTTGVLAYPADKRVKPSSNGFAFTEKPR